MSTTIDDKLKLFHKAIFDKLEEKRAQELEKFNKEKEEAINKKKAQLEKDKSAYIRDITKKAEVKANELISSQEVIMYREVLKLKSSLIEETEKAIKERLISFTEAKEYREFFMKNVAKVLPELKADDYILMARKKDIANLQADISALADAYKDITLSFGGEPTDIIGGFIIENRASKFKYDCTLLNMLKESREEIGILVTEALR